MAVPLASALASNADPRAAVALGPLRWTDLFAQWRLDPLVLALLVAAAAGYAWYRMRGRELGVTWPHRRDVTFALGVAAGVWVSCGVAQVRAAGIEWVWIAQLLALLLVVPFLLLAGQPVALAREVGGDRSAVSRIAGSRVTRAVGHPLIGPAMVPVIFALILFAGAGQAAASSPPAGWVLQAVLLVIGLAIAVPLVDNGQAQTSMAIGLALAVGFFELFLDVFPGIALRLADHPVIPYFAAHTPGWTAGWLYEQHQAGGLLWIASEILDLPFLILLAVRWVRVDTAEAARIDAALDAAAAGGAALAGATGATTATGATSDAAGTDAAAGDGAVAPAPPGEAGRQRPWFLDDPQLRDRYRF